MQSMDPHIHLTVNKTYQTPLKKHGKIRYSPSHER